ncbi:N-6 DNA methylase [Candidatus Chloroploca sp. M-50]|uniref:site-specific DNA-methyltransferase (adenine-specific) n=2 Tax=Candidatus Chloroploca mongolica TaxID=2528176 RepID=A0ABS4D9Y4_9CHLR|nr:class I SAM-dependent DNA methyltransferase [Candidatus Chloroploca mongolica]MBP1466233.1 N-6 DNA methylase [Candidatus Chloroploca mongolica]
MPPGRKRTTNQSAAITNGPIMASTGEETNGRHDLSLLENRLWEAADQLRANSKLKSSEYSIPVLGLIFLRYADYRFTHIEQELKVKQGASSRRTIGKADYQARGVMYVPEEARFARLLTLPEGADIAKVISEAMKAIEADNPALKDVLPKEYRRLGNDVLVPLLKTLNAIPMDAEGDTFGRIYEYFLGEFARSEGQKGGEFYTPTALVKLIVEVIEPFHGRIFDPACGSGGMFVQSARFVENHKRNPNAEISIYGQEKVGETARLCRMNLAVHGLGGEIRDGNSYYEDLHRSVGQFDFVMANPPFNVNGVDKSRLKDDPRFPFGMPTPDNANYLWIQHFYSALTPTGRTGFVMSSSAADARGSEQEIRRKLIEAQAVDVMIAIGPNFFYTVTLPCMLWFFDRNKARTARKDTVLFIDARQIYRQIDRAHRDFTPTQVEFLANIARLYRDEQPEQVSGSENLLAQHFPDGAYQDIAGLCKVATLDEIKAQGWSLNPGRYVGVAARAADNFDFAVQLEELNEELEQLNAEARLLEERIAEHVEQLLVPATVGQAKVPRRD